MRDRVSVVLRVRRAQERLAGARAARAEVEARAAADVRRRRAEAHARRDAPAGQLTAAQLRGLRLQGLASYAHLLAAAHAHDEADGLRDAAVADHTAAAVRRKGAERLVERHHEAAAMIAASTAQRTLDDLTVARWRAR